MLFRNNLATIEDNIFNKTYAKYASFLEEKNNLKLKKYDVKTNLVYAFAYNFKIRFSYMFKSLRFVIFLYWLTTGLKNRQNSLFNILLLTLGLIYTLFTILNPACYPKNIATQFSKLFLLRAFKEVSIWFYFKFCVPLSFFFTLSTTFKI